MTMTNRVEKITASVKVESRVFDLMEIKEPCGVKHYWIVEPGKGNNRLTKAEYENAVKLFAENRAESWIKSNWLF